MTTRFLTTALLAFTVTLGSPAWAYDAALAESYAQLFAPAEGAAVGKALHMMTPEAFVNALKTTKGLVAVDVRTPAEAGIYGVTLPGSLAIPLNQLFSEANLQRIPTDRTVVVLCLSGTRATAAGTALRHIGFDNVYVLKGGFKALTAYLGPKEANAAPLPAPASPGK